MEITQDSLVLMLKAHPSTDKELGWNTAIVTLLQWRNRKSSINPLAAWANPQQIEEIDAAIKNGKLLMAVKLLKECGNLGLREAKDILDDYARNFHAE